MAQVLKDNLRQDIIKAAKEEFLKYGYDGASMRRIASKANMTVGNLYRYFKNKDDINVQIVGPTYEKINAVMKKVSSSKLPSKTGVYNMRIDTVGLGEMFDEFADQLIDLYNSEPVEFSILMFHSNLNKEFEKWFKDVVKNLTMNSYIPDDFDRYGDILAKCFAVSIFSGVKELFATKDITIDELRRLLKAYFRTYVYTLDTDIKTFFK